MTPALALTVAVLSLLAACLSLSVSLHQLLDSFWREIEIGACAWWAG